MALFLPVAIVRQHAVNLKLKISVGAEVTRLKLDESQRLLTSSPTISKRATHAFTLVEILVVVVLMSFIILALMAVFSSTQSAFRASLTQTDVLEGGRSVMGLVTSDLESMTPSFGQSNQPVANGYSTVPVNFYANTNIYQYQFGSTPLVQALTGSSGFPRTNVLENFFILTRQNTTWTGVGYVVDTGSTNYFNPLYRFTVTTNMKAASPLVLYNLFLTNAVIPVEAGLTISPNDTTMSHLVDGVVHLTVRAYDTNGVWMTNGYANLTNLTVKNVRFQTSTLGEVGFYMYSNALPAAVEVELGLLEDRALQRAESLANNATAQMNYLSNHAGQVHLFRQRIPIRNVDPSAYR